MMDRGRCKPGDRRTKCQVISNVVLGFDRKNPRDRRKKQSVATRIMTAPRGAELVHVVVTMKTGKQKEAFL